MNFKPASLFLLSVLFISATATSPQQALSNALKGMEQILEKGNDVNNERLIPECTSSTDCNETTLYEKLHRITEIYEAQEAAMQATPALRPVLEGLVTDACALIKAITSYTGECNSYSNVLSLKAKLDLYKLSVDANDLLMEVHAESLSVSPEAFYVTIPCDGDGTPNDIVTSVIPNFPNCS